MNLTARPMVHTIYRDGYVQGYNINMFATSSFCIRERRTSHFLWYISKVFKNENDSIILCGMHSLACIIIMSNFYAEPWLTIIIIVVI